MKTLFFDTETTGLYDWKKDFNHADQPDLLQLGCILEDDNRKEMARVKLLIRPKGNVVLSDGAFAAHGISLLQCETYGVERVSALQVFGELVCAADLLVAHNIKFDESIMETNFHRELVVYPGLQKNKICTMLASQPVCRLPSTRGGFKWPKLEEAYFYFFNEKMEGAHDALVDVEACRRIYHHMKDAGHV